MATSVLPCRFRGYIPPARPKKNIISRIVRSSDSLDKAGAPVGEKKQAQSSPSATELANPAQAETCCVTKAAYAGPIGLANLPSDRADCRATEGVWRAL